MAEAKVVTVAEERVIVEEVEHIELVLTRREALKVGALYWETSDRDVEGIGTVIAHALDLSERGVEKALLDEFGLQVNVSDVRGLRFTTAVAEVDGC